MSDKTKETIKDSKILYCSFCGKGQNEVRKLIAGPSVFICEECVDLCNNIIDEELSEASSSEGLNLYKPREINAMLDDYVIDQNEAKHWPRQAPLIRAVLEEHDLKEQLEKVGKHTWPCRCVMRHGQPRRMWCLGSVAQYQVVVEVKCRQTVDCTSTLGADTHIEALQPRLETLHDEIESMSSLYETSQGQVAALTKQLDVKEMAVGDALLAQARDRSTLTAAEDGRTRRATRTPRPRGGTRCRDGRAGARTGSRC